MKLHKRICKILAICLILFSITQSAAAYTASNTDTPVYTIHEPYEYPITSDSPEWFETDSHAVRVKYCQIPQNILRNMDTEALIKTICAYPLLCDLMAYNSADQGYRALRHNLNAVRELENRNDADTVLTELLSQNEKTGKNNLSATWIQDTAMKILALVGPFAVSVSTQNNNNDTKSIDFMDVYKFYPELDQNTTDELIVPASTNSMPLPKTPSGNDIPENHIQDRSNYALFTTNQINEINTEMYEKYGLRPISSPNPRYNCHSFAWYSRSINNNWWIYYPEAFTKDPLVSEIYGLSNLVVNDRITYYDFPLIAASHSGIITKFKQIDGISCPIITSTLSQNIISVKSRPWCYHSTRACFFRSGARRARVCARK